MPPLLVGTTFSGIGAPEQALKNLKIPHVNKWACEIDKYCKTTYIANHQVEKWYDDINTIDVNRLEYVDLYVFGFPCQSYSFAGKGMGLEDHRGKLIYQSLKILQEKQPLYFLAENVKGLVFHDSGNTFKIIRDAFVDCGYKIYYKLLNSSDFNVPQFRQRIYIVGVRKDVDFHFEFLQGDRTELRVKDILEDKVDEVFFANRPDLHWFENPKMSNNGLKTLGGFCPKPDGAKLHRSMIPQGNRIYSSDGFACTIRLGTGVGGQGGLYLVNDRVRRLTVKECARLQGFGNDFIFPKSAPMAKRQLGNSMTVSVLESILSQLPLN